MTRPFAEVMATRTARPWWLAVLIAGRATDVGMSVLAFSAGAAEANPVSRVAWEHGLAGLLVQQAVGVAVIALVISRMPAARGFAQVLVAAMSWLPVAWNVALITGLIRF